MASYYFLISSLPDLRADEGMPFSYEEFLDYCHSSVSESKYQLLKDLSLSSGKGPLLKEWGAFYGVLEEELNAQRRARLGKPAASSYEKKDDATSQVVAAALAAKNPLEAEKVLLAYEFEGLDSLVGMHYFDDYVLFGYAIKMKLLERQSCFEQTKGKAEFKRLFDQVQQRVYSL